MKRILCSLGSALALAVVATPAAAQDAGTTPSCSSLTKPILYIQGSTAAKPFIGALGAALSSTTTIVYYGGGSCSNGVASFVPGTTGSTVPMAGSTANATANYYTPKA